MFSSRTARGLFTDIKTILMNYYALRRSHTRDSVKLTVYLCVHVSVRLFQL